MTLAVIQARMTSSRLPGKVLLPLGRRSVLGWVVGAAYRAEIGQVVVATSTDASDDPVVAAARDLGAEVVRGPLDDVLGRYLLALDRYGDQPVVRLTGDCPFLDSRIIRMVARAFDPGVVDYLSTVTPRSLPRGLDVEIAASAALRTADRIASPAQRAHVTAALYHEPGRFRVGGLTFSPAAEDLRVTLDTAEDLRLLEAVVARLGDRSGHREDLVAFLRKHPDVAALNREVRPKRIEEG